MLVCTACVGMAGWQDSDGIDGWIFDDDNLTYEILDETSRTVSVKGYLDDEPTLISIPDTVDNDGQKYTVISIGGRVFKNCTSLTNIDIPNTVTSIGKGAFYGTGLTSVTIPSGVTQINDETFKHCPLSSVTFLGQVASIGANAFFGCTSLTNIDIPNTVTSIGNSAFHGTGLTSVTIPSGVTQINEWTFGWCNDLSSVTFLGQVASIGVAAFFMCRSLTEIQIPETVTSIGASAFKCSQLMSVTIPSGVTQIARDTFNSCASLSSITFQGPITSIGESAFDDCIGLSSITFDTTGLSSIGGGAFKNCTSLTEIQIPDSVTSIGTSAFNGCGGLQSILFGKGIETIGDDAFNKQTFYDETGTIAFDPSTQVGELQGRLFKADGAGSSKMIRQPQSLYTLTFDCGDGITKEAKYNEGDRIAKPDDPEKTGYSFMRWEKDGEEFDFANATMPAEDMTLTAAWKVNRHTISFDPDGGSPVDPITQDYGTLVEKPADPTKDGYSFLYWAKDGKEYTFGTMPAEDIVLRAVWEAHAFTVTFVTGTGTEIAYERAYGSSMTIPGEGGEISKAGYSLSGWQISGQGDVYGPGTEYRVASDVTFTAVWKAVPSPAPAPSGDDDDEGKDSDSGSGTSVAAVAIAAGCAAVLLAMIRKGKSGS